MEPNKSLKEITKEKDHDSISVHKLIEFLEYEEGLTRDNKTAERISALLKQLKIWS
jgi:hypothetical protein